MVSIATIVSALSSLQQPVIPLQEIAQAEGRKPIVETPLHRELSPLKRIEIDLKSQTLSAFEDDQKIYEFLCSTGKNNGTPRGDWPVRQKLRYNRALPEYGSVPIPFSLRLDIVVNGRRKRIAIHAHKSVPRYPASHGCIRLKYPDAEKLFRWADVGIIVAIR